LIPIIANVTDAVNNEQLNVSVGWINNSYDISEILLVYGEFLIHMLKLYKVISDALNHCTLPISLYRGQSCDGAVNRLG